MYVKGQSHSRNVVVPLKVYILGEEEKTRLGAG